MRLSAIGLETSEKQAAEVLDKIGGGKIATVLAPPENLPKSVTSKGGKYRCSLSLDRESNTDLSHPVFALSIFGEFKDVGKAVWQDFLPGALKSGQFVPAPDEEVVGKGLDALQEAFDKQKAGVSAKKIVVSL